MDTAPNHTLKATQNLLGEVLECQSSMHVTHREQVGTKTAAVKSARGPSGSMWLRILNIKLFRQALIICELGLNNYHQQPEMKDCRTSPEMVHSWEEEIGQTEEHPVMGFPGKL